ncbi:MAG: hypothetical protein NTW28_09435 [Candidatus Solibacter sp.]|nr:hypothetical protein [Candidatus Solibacter sp.]
METALARLRAKTDQELCTLVARQLKRSRRLAGRGAYRDAAKDYLTAKALLAVADIPAAERAGLERLMQEVRQTIELPMTAVA